MESEIEEDLQSGIMPNLTGINLKDALYLLERYGMQVKVLGSGGVVKQSVKMGEKVIKGTVVRLELA